MIAQIATRSAWCVACLALLSHIDALTAFAQVSPSEDSAANDGIQIYQRSFFDRFNPQSARDLIDRLPGFALDSGEANASWLRTIRRQCPYRRRTAVVKGGRHRRRAGSRPRRSGRADRSDPWVCRVHRSSRSGGRREHHPQHIGTGGELGNGPGESSGWFVQSGGRAYLRTLVWRLGHLDHGQCALGTETAGRLAGLARRGEQARFYSARGRIQRIGQAFCVIGSHGPTVWRQTHYHRPVWRR